MALSELKKSNYPITYEADAFRVINDLYTQTAEEEPRFPSTIS